MATEDISRQAWYPTKRYAGVRMQQGRVLTDDDFNEANLIASEDARRALLDVVGATGTPDSGFRVTAPTRAGTQLDFTLGAGTMYLGGLRIVLPDSVPFSAQPDWLRQRTLDRTGPAAAGTTLVYLEAWQQPVGAVEDAELFEVALGGADTTMRMRTMWRVRQISVSTAECTGAWSTLTSALTADLRGEWRSANCALDNDLSLQVTYTKAAVAEDLCSPGTVAGYLGANNTAIRVQLVEPSGSSPAALTWGFDNGAPLYRVEVDSTGVITFGTEPKDQAHWPLMGQTVEALPWSALLDPNRELVAEGHGRADTLTASETERISAGNGFLATLSQSYNPTTRQARLSTPLPANFNTLAPAHSGANVDKDGTARSYVYLRVWDRGSDYTSNARIDFNPATDVVTLGNTGIVVQLLGTHYRADAHWIIAARPQTPDEVVPWGLERPTGHPPMGLTTALCPLATIQWGATSAVAPVVQDCRHTFRPLTRQKDCCNVTVGDGEHSFGDYSSIQEAIDNLPATGGQVCILEGEYRERVEITGRSNITITGCGERSLLVSTGTDGDGGVNIVDSSSITLDGFAIAADTGWGVLAEAVSGECTELQLRNLIIQARDYGAIAVDAEDAHSIRGVEISGCRLEAGALAADPSAESVVGRLPLVWLRAEDVTVTGNKVVGPASDNPVRRGMGGIQLAGGCAGVRLLDNSIQGGNGNGITLGSIREETTSGRRGWLLPYYGFYFYYEDGCLKIGSWWTWTESRGGTVEITLIAEDPLTDIAIRQNHIQDMAGDGVGVAWFFDQTVEATGAGSGVPSDFITVEDLRIHDNRIESNCTGQFVAISDFVATTSLHGGISLADVDRLDVRGGRIVGHGGTRDTSLAAIFAQVVTGARVFAVQAWGNGAQSDNPVPGNSGGIVFRWASPSQSGTDGWNGAPAVAVHDCMIDAPQGHPLFALSNGTMSVQSNQLSGHLGGDSVTGLLGCGVWLGSFGGFSEDFSGFTTSPPDSPEEAGNLQILDNMISLRRPSEGGAKLTYFVHLMGGSGDLALHHNHIRTDFGASFSFVHVYGPGSTVAASANRAQETMGRCFTSVGVRGGFAAELGGNMGTHCFVEEDPLAGITSGTNNRSLYADSLSGSSTETDWCKVMLSLWSGFVEATDAGLEEIFPQLSNEGRTDDTRRIVQGNRHMSSYIARAERGN